MTVRAARIACLIIGSVVILCWFASFWLQGPPTTYPPIGRVTKIDIEVARDGRDLHLRQIRDSAQIAKVVAFVDSHRVGWRSIILTAPPSPTLMASFYEDSTWKGNFGLLGKDLYAWRGEERVVADASEGEWREFLDLLQVPPADAGLP